MIWHLFFQPFIEYGFMRRALVVCLALSVSTTALGVFLQLRRMSLMGDALSHAILPGVAVGYLLSGLSLLAGQRAALQSGAGTIFDSLLSAANTQLGNLLTRTGLSYTPMTRENYAAVLADVQQQIGGAALKAAGLSRLTTPELRMATPTPPIERIGRVPGVFCSPMPYIV